MQNQTFNIIYQNECFSVDPSYLYDASGKFRELIDNASNLHPFQLRINYDKFSSRNVGNFLKICQKLPADVQNSEIEEICLIAKMFQADEIYNTGILFIQENIDPNFFIPYNTFSEENCGKFLQLETEKEEEIPLYHHADLKHLEFDDSSGIFRVKKDNKSDSNSNEQKKQKRTTCYQIICDNRIMKCRRFYLKKDNDVICMAKLKEDEIYIGEGNNLHISQNKMHNTGRITRTKQGFNIVNIMDQEFKVKYIQYGPKYSINVTFMHDGRQLNWKPKQVNRLENLRGAYNHVPIFSNKNIMLQNQSNHPTLVVRKMAKKTFEAECNPHVNPLVVFAISLSEIVGPISM